MEPQRTRRAKKRVKINIYLFLIAVFILGTAITGIYSYYAVSSKPAGVLAPGDTPTQPAK